MRERPHRSRQTATAIDAFTALGRAIDARWREHDRDERAFAELASEALGAHRLAGQVTGEDVASWLFATPSLPEQDDLAASFASPPITVYQGAGFFIDALYWTHGSTDIHQHGFSGAFQMLEGECLHGRYSFHTSDRINATMQLGTLSLTELEILRTGAVRTIASGEGLIHATYHLGRPSISLVVRTHSDADAGPQLSYRPPHLGIVPLARRGAHSRDALFVRRLQLLAALQATAHPSWERLTRTWLGEANLPETYWILSQSAEVLERDELGICLELAQRRHGARGKLLGEVITEEQRRRKIGLRAADLHAAEPRLLVGLALFAPGRRLLQALLSTLRPGHDAARVLTDWAAALSRSDSDGESPWPVALEGQWLDVLAELLRGRTVPQLLVELERRHDPAEVRAAEPLITRFANAAATSALLSGLLRA